MGCLKPGVKLPQPSPGQGGRQPAPGGAGFADMIQQGKK